MTCKNNCIDKRKKEGDTLNERVKELRKFFGLSGEKFGEKLGITRGAVSNIENGSRNVTEQMIKSICREFNVSEEWLRTGEGEMFVHITSNETKMQLLHLIDKLPESKLGYVLAYVQGLYINEHIEKE